MMPKQNPQVALIKAAVDELGIDSGADAERQQAIHRLSMFAEFAPHIVRANKGQQPLAQIKEELDGIAKAARRLKGVLIGAHSRTKGELYIAGKYHDTPFAPQPGDMTLLIKLIEWTEQCAKTALENQSGESMGAEWNKSTVEVIRSRPSDAIGAKAEIVRFCRTMWERHAKTRPTASISKGPSFASFCSMVWEIASGKREANLTRQIRRVLEDDTQTPEKN